MSEDNFKIKVSAGLTQMGGNSFPILRAKDVDVSGTTLTKFLPIVLTQEQYNSLIEGNQVLLENGEVISYDYDQVYFIKPIINM